MIFHFRPHRMHAVKVNRVAAEQAMPETALAGLAPAAVGVSPLRGRRAATQGGGTFLGVILGVVFGLAAALGVAIYVAKVPVPFVNKNTSRTSGQDAAEAEKNRDWDPNAPLRNRNAAKPSGGGTVSSGTVAPAPEPAPIPAPAEVARPAPAVVKPAEVKPAEVKSAETKPAESKPAETKPPRTAESKPATRAADKASEPPPVATRLPRPTSNDPLGDLAAARSGNAPAAQTAEAFTYFVQAGAFRTSEDADAQRARLQLMGVEARVTEREQSGRTVYRVRVGPFQNKDAADRVKDRLDGNGFDSALVRVQR